MGFLVGVRSQAIKQLAKSPCAENPPMKSALPTRITLSLMTLAVLGAVPVAAQQAITYEQAETAMDAAEAEAEARSNGWNLTILIADAEGVPICLRRMDSASPRTHDVASRKVRTALASGMATGDYGQAVAVGRVPDVPNGVTFEGGYPIRMGGHIVGAMSASGARGSEDAQLVRAGLAAIGLQP
jgi:glc operon protein GlcG